MQLHGRYCSEIYAKQTFPEWPFWTTQLKNLFLITALLKMCLICFKYPSLLKKNQVFLFVLFTVFFFFLVGLASLLSLSLIKMIPLGWAFVLTLDQALNTLPLND